MEIENVLYVFRVFGSIISIWPPSSKAGKRELVLRDLAWSIALSNVVYSFMPLLHTIYCYSSDVVKVMKALSEFTAIAEVFFNLILFRVERAKLQDLIAKIEAYTIVMNKGERAVLKKYIARYLGFYTFVGISYAMAAVTFSCGPLFLSTQLPGEVTYPFSIEEPMRRFVLYVLQVFVILQTGFGIIVDFIVAMLFWFPAARLEILGLELEKAKKENQIRTCIKEHQEIIQFVVGAKDAVKYIICKTNITMALAVICGAFPLVYNQPLTVTSQFICMVIGGCQSLYVTAWPADDLRENSQQLAWSAYAAQWVGASPRMGKSILILIQRCKRPLVIRMGGIFPALTLEYYANVRISHGAQIVKAAIMVRRMDIHRVFRLLRAGGEFTCTWPPPPGAGIRELILRDVYCAISTLCMLTLIIPITLAIYFYRADLLVTLKAIAELMAVLDALVDIVWCRIVRLPLQNIIKSMKSFVNACEESEKEVLQQYIDRYFMFYSYLTFASYASGIAFICGPLFLSTKFPGEVWFPFSTEMLYRRCIIYILQSFVIMQTITSISVDFTISTMFWFSSARLNITCLQLRRVQNVDQLEKCIRLHQEIIEFVQEIQDAVQALLFKSNITMALTVISGALALLSNQPFAVSSQFITMILGACQKLYVVAWPANDLKEISQQVAWAAYDVPWIDRSAEMASNVAIMIQRSQKPLLISLGILPPLSLEYYATFLKTIFSYFMTIRSLI
ncbi:hypothetical protein KM043_018405 [Ampulex compressa]|nr:hypothetical protein KM043_018405 [Ampulex compressa]